jgi:membrane-associated HD superfamily phosphohydrolase
MQYTNASVTEVRQAQSPHNLFIIGLFTFDLLMTPAVIAMKIGMMGLFIPLVCSGTLMIYIYLRSRKVTGSWFVDTHWKLAFQRALLLLMGYGISAALILVAWLISLLSHDPNMQRILLTALTRIALMPTLILVLITSVMEFGAYSQAGKREMPDKIAAKYPPPA